MSKPYSSSPGVNDLIWFNPSVAKNVTATGSTILKILKNRVSFPAPTTWQETLDQLHTEFDLWTSAQGADLHNKMEQFTQIMQERFPGPYVVEEFFNAPKGRFDYRLKFESEKQELMWKIKFQ